MPNRQLQLPEKYLFLLFFFGVLSSITLTSCFKFGWTREPLSGNSDLLCYYMMGHILHQYPHQQLYDINTQKIIQQQYLKNGVVFHGGVMVYVHPPFEALWFYPLSWLPYPTAYWVWLGLNLTSLFFLPLVLVRAFSLKLWPHLLIIYLAMVCYMPIIICLYRGQDSILFLWIILSALCFFKKERDFAGGCVLGLAFFRFHIAYLIAVPLFLKWRKKGILGLLSSLALLALISIGLIGTEGIRKYFLLLKEFNQPQFASGFNLSDMHCWATQVLLWGFHQARDLWFTAVIAMTGMVIVGVIWRNGWNISAKLFEVNFAATILVALLASPYLYVYDGTMLFLPWFICYKHSTSSHLSRLSQGLLICILSTIHLAWIFWPILVESWRIQPTVFIMSGLLFVLMLIGAKEQQLDSN
jgi:hypothetical protein